MMISRPRTPTKPDGQAERAPKTATPLSRFSSPLKLRDQMSPALSGRLLYSSGKGSLSMRVDQPVQNCALQPHTFYRHSGPATQSAFHMSYRWYRSPRKLVCANPGCPQVESKEGLSSKATIECVVCLKLAISRQYSCFCSVECFRTTWPSHSRLHSTHQKTRNGLLIGNGSSAAPGSVANDDAKVENSNGVKEAVPAFDETSLTFTSTAPVEEDVWVEVGDQKQYTPTSEDVGHVLRVECTVFEGTGSVVSAPQSVETDIVLPTPPDPPPRRFLYPRAYLKNGLDSRAPKLRVMSYNLLAEIYASRQMYSYCPLWALQWSYRRNLLLRDIAQCSPDIACLQEVQADHFDDFFHPKMKELGYEGVYKQKTRESMGLEGKVDGCAIFFKRGLFEIKEKYVIEFNEAAASAFESRRSLFEAKHPPPTPSQQTDYDKMERLALQRLLKDNIAQVVILNYVKEGPGKSFQVCVANTHILSNPEFADVKLWQTQTLIRELEKLVSARNIPLILCGDFNSEPKSAVYELISQQRVRYDHQDFEKDVAGILSSSSSLTHKMSLTSAYAAVAGSEPSYTNYTEKWVGVVDYIWLSSDTLETVSVLETHPPSVLQDYCKTALPNSQFPSDHVPIVADLQLVRRGLGVGSRAQQSYLHSLKY